MTDHRFFKLIPQSRLIELWGVNEETLRRWRKERGLRATKLGKLVFYDPDDVQDFVDGNRESGAVVPIRRGRKL